MKRGIGFNDFALAAHRAVALGGKAHRFADAHGKEPRGLVGPETEVALQLERTDALLAGGHQVERKQPLVERDMRALHDGASAARELVAAVAAEEHTGLSFAAHTHRVERAAMRAVDLTIGPAGRLDMALGGGFVRENLAGQVGHRSSPMTTT